MAGNTTLFDAYGRPVRRAGIAREADFPSVSGIRQLWDETVTTGLTPVKLAAVLREAAAGDAHAYLTLAEEMEEHDLHYFSVLATRRLAVAGIEPVVEAATDAARDVELADAVRELAAAPAFEELVNALMDALGKGYAAAEIHWATGGGKWTPERYEWRDPRLFHFDRQAGRELRIADPANVEGLPLHPFKFIVHHPGLKAGLPIRGGLARFAAWCYLVKNYTVKDWIAFAEVYGMPLRVGRYGAGATDEDKRTLLRAVANIGSDAAAIIPESMKIEFEKSGAGEKGGGALFEGLAEWADKQLSKGILGQTATTEGTPGKLGNQDAQENVRLDILAFDARRLAATLNRHLVRPYIDLNFGPQEVYPRLTLPVTEPEDIAGMAEALAKLVPLGNLGIQASVVRDRLGFPDPEEGAELLGAATPTPEEKPGGKGRAKNTAHHCAHCGGLATNAQAQPDDLDELDEDALADWEPLLDPAVGELLEALQAANSYQEAQAALDGLAETGLDLRKLTDALARATFLARGTGEGGDKV